MTGKWVRIQSFSSDSLFKLSWVVTWGAVMFYQMFTASGLTWYCGGALWTATFSEQRVCENFKKKDWVILHGSSMICTIISGSLPDTEPVFVSEVSLTDWCWVTAWRLSLLSWLRTACFALSKMYFRIISILLRMEAVKQWHWCLESGKIHCWTVEILGGKSCGKLWKVVEARV